MKVWVEIQDEGRLSSRWALALMGYLDRYSPLLFSRSDMIITMAKVDIGYIGGTIIRVEIGCGAV